MKRKLKQVKKENEIFFSVLSKQSLNDVIRNWCYAKGLNKDDWEDFVPVRLIEDVEELEKKIHEMIGKQIIGNQFDKQ